MLSSVRTSLLLGISVSTALACVEPKAVGMTDEGESTSPTEDTDSASTGAQTEEDSGTGSTSEEDSGGSTTADDSTAYETGEGCPVLDDPCDITWVPPQKNILTAFPYYPTGHFTVPMVAEACPPGTEPFLGFPCESDCPCSFICPEDCGPRGVCIPGEGGDAPHCACHRAFAGEPGSCSWLGLLDNGDFAAGCEGWKFFAQRSKAFSPLSIEVVDERLHMTGERCEEAYALAEVRIPDAAEFPDGAAVVFDYSLSYSADKGDSTADVGFSQSAWGQIPWGQGWLLPDTMGETVAFRECLDLPDVATMATLDFHIEGFGYCDQALLIELYVDDVRIEADPGC